MTQQAKWASSRELIKVLKEMDIWTIDTKYLHIYLDTRFIGGDLQCTIRGAYRLSRRTRQMRKVKDITGQKFGRLTVIKIDHKDKKGEIYWKCRCDCGNIAIIRNSNLLSGHTKSCGCLWKKHKQSYSRIYRIFCGMKQRCYNPNATSYKNYGERGIIICDEWLSDFMNFHHWAINNGYKEGLTIERINNNGNYEPNNCKWITKSEQQDNTRNCKFIEYKGEVHNISQWAKKLNIKRNALASKLYKGLSLKSIIEKSESEE